MFMSLFFLSSSSFFFFAGVWWRGYTVLIIKLNVISSPSCLFLLLCIICLHFVKDLYFPFDFVSDIFICHSRCSNLYIDGIYCVFV